MTEETKTPTPALPHSEPSSASAEATEDKPVGEGAMAEPIKEKPATPPETTATEPALASPAPTEPNPLAEPAEEVKPAEITETETPLPEVKPDPGPSTPAPAPAPAPTADPSSKDDEANFNTQFKDKLRQLRVAANAKRLKKVEENEKKILDYALANNRVDNKAARELTGLSDDRARFYLNKLEKQGKLTQMGKTGPKIFYMLVK
ncbi:MAG: hypothetical protein PHZ04_03915 [Patescibacteria group bacterium]|nr:hypothetical protein [Patescibacteria group bacterium]MDD5294895.1 hypothetical protein [Patescibacteria group bacterium]MDD5554055.1 hypothetical protein [Patescibacteria group bacterium]